jgi:hypothetical protein
MKAKTMTTNTGIARRRVDIRTPSSAAKSPRADGAYSFAAPMRGLAFIAWTVRNELPGCKNFKTELNSSQAQILHS